MWMQRDNARPGHDTTRHDPRAAARRAAAGGTFRAGHVMHRKQASVTRNIILFFCESGVEAALLHLLRLLFIRWLGAQSTLFPGSWCGICTPPSPPANQLLATNCAALCACRRGFAKRTRALLALDSPPPPPRAPPRQCCPARSRSLSSTANLAALTRQARR